MTLLSIREQEAVKDARKDLAHELGPIGNREWAAAALKRYDRALILATRDAIARQVRERDLGAKIVNDDTATFIEDLDV